MKAGFLIENCERFLPTLSKILPTHSQVPVLSNLLIEATEEGIFIYATNLEIGIRVAIPAKVEEKGSTTVPGKQFIEALSSLPKDRATIEIERDTLKIKSRNNTISFQTIASSEFPTIFEEKGEKIHEFTEEEMRSHFEGILFAAALDDARPELTGILVSPKDGATDFVATDGFRLSLKKVKGGSIVKGDQLILPAKLIGEAMALKSDKITMYVFEGSKQVIFEVEDALLVGRLIAGTFPNYERVIPVDSKTKITLDTAEFLQKLRLAGIFAKDSANIIKATIEGGKVTLQARAAGVGEGEVVLEGEQTGDSNEIAFNIKFLNDLLKNTDAKSVVMHVSSPVEPAKFTLEDNPDYIHIIMPVRVQE